MKIGIPASRYPLYFVWIFVLTAEVVLYDAVLDSLMSTKSLINGYSVLLVRIAKISVRLP